MGIYILMIVISLGAVYFSLKANNNKIRLLFYIISIIPFILVSALRFDVGTDYMYRYVPNYLSFVKGSQVDSLEPIFSFLIKLCVLISKDYALLFSVTSILINTFIMIAIYKNSKNIIISVLIFFVGSFFFQSMNLVRQYLAMSIMVLSYNLIFEKKYIILWIISVIIAMLIHSMSVVFIIAILLDKKVINYKVLIGLLGAFVLLGRYIIDTLLGLTQCFNVVNISKYAHYVNAKGDLPISTIVVEVILYLFIYLSYVNLKRNNIKITKETIFFVNMQTVTLFFTVLNIHIELFFRVALLFSVFQIISISYFYELNKKCEFRLFDQFKKRKMPNILKKIIEKLETNKKSNNLIILIVVIMLLSSRMIYSNIIKGADKVLPYKTIFSEERKI